MLDALRRRQPGAPLWRVLLYEVCRRTSRAVIWTFFGLHHIHRDRVPQSGALLIAANHESYLDPPSLGSVITHRHICYMARAGLFKFRPFAWLIRSLNSIPVDEEGGDVAAIKETIRRLEGGAGVLIFPEGSRSPTGEMMEFKRGVAVLMKRAKCPVQPAAIVGAFEAWPRGKRPRLFRRGVRVIYGHPIPYEELMRDGPDGALERLRREIAALREQARAWRPDAAPQPTA
jgi:1-acyl-sn-glycerol-3-phosphate acyltransferase